MSTVLGASTSTAVRRSARNPTGWPPQSTATSSAQAPAALINVGAVAEPSGRSTDHAPACRPTFATMQLFTIVAPADRAPRKKPWCRASTSMSIASVSSAASATYPGLQQRHAHASRIRVDGGDGSAGCADLADHVAQPFELILAGHVQAAAGKQQCLLAESIGRVVEKGAACPRQRANFASAIGRCKKRRRAARRVISGARLAFDEADARPTRQLVCE